MCKYHVTAALVLAYLGLIFSAPQGLAEPKPQCLAMVESKCTERFDNQHKGNIAFNIKNQVLTVRSTAKNGIPYAIASFLAGIKKALPGFPKPVVEAFDNVDYPRLLNKVTGNEPQISDVQKAIKIWRGLYRTLLEQMVKQNPRKGRAIAEEFQARIYGGIWQDHPGWKNVERTFQRVRDEYIRFFQN